MRILSLLFFVGVFVLSSCKKEAQVPNTPTPPNPVDTTDTSGTSGYTKKFILEFYNAFTDGTGYNQATSTVIL